jgi:hypothetical protein
MSRVPYASAVGNLIYAMVCTRPDIAMQWDFLAGICQNKGRSIRQ